MEKLQASWPGRPSPQTAASVLLLSLGIGLQRVNRPGTPQLWAMSLLGAAGIPLLAVLAYLSGALSLVRVAPSTGMAISTALAVTLVVVAAFGARPDRHPVAWLLARPDRQVLLQAAALLAGLPVLIALARLLFLTIGGREHIEDDTDWVLAIAISTITIGAAAFFIGQRAQKRLAASEQRFRLLTENTADMVTLVQGGRLAWVSPSISDALGAPPDYWLGREIGEIVPAEDRARLARKLKILADGGTIKQRVRVQSVDGVSHWTHMHAKPYRDGSNQDGFTAAFRLIDDEVAAEQEVEEARRLQAQADQRYRESVENAAIGMCLVTPEGRFYEVNDALCRLFGYDAAALKHKTWQELTAPEYVQADQRNVTNVLEGRIDSYRMTKQFIHADGHRIWGDLSVSCIRDESGAVVNFVSQIADITAARQAEQRSRALAQRLRRQTAQMEAELKSAAAYLSSIMPGEMTGRVSVFSRYLPSSELGGDCFDYLWIDDDHLLIYLIDVSGHGIEPALLSVSVHNLLRSGSLQPEILLDPPAALGELNRLFQMDRQHDHYFTVWYAVYDAPTRTLHYAGAGAPPALLFTAAADGTTTSTELSCESAPVGMFAETTFGGRTCPMSPGCRLLLFSDGAFEIFLADDLQMSLQEFEALSTRLAGSPDWSLDDLVGELTALSATNHFDDDCSLILLTFN